MEEYLPCAMPSIEQSKKKNLHHLFLLPKVVESFFCRSKNAQSSQNVMLMT
jgi:hypothetical protein